MTSHCTPNFIFPSCDSTERKNVLTPFCILKVLLSSFQKFDDNPKKRNRLLFTKWQRANWLIARVFTHLFFSYGQQCHFKVVALFKNHRQHWKLWNECKLMVVMPLIITNMCTYHFSRITCTCLIWINNIARRSHLNMMNDSGKIFSQCVKLCDVAFFNYYSQLDVVTNFH